MRSLVLLLAAPGLSAGAAYAQQYSGLNPQGQTVTVTLNEKHQGTVTGSLSSGGISMALTGAVDDDLIIGTVEGDGTRMFFEAEADGESLYLILLEVDARGEPNNEKGQEITLTTATGGAAPPAGVMIEATPDGNSAVGVNPFAGSNPLAAAGAADPVPGTYSNGAVTVVLQGAQGQYQGQIAACQGPWTVTVNRQQNGVLGGQFPVAMRIQGTTMILESGGQSYQLQKQRWRRRDPSIRSLSRRRLSRRPAGSKGRMVGGSAMERRPGTSGRSFWPARNSPRWSRIPRALPVATTCARTFICAPTASSFTRMRALCRLM